MRHMLKAAAILGGLSVSLGATSAQAGGCGYGPGQGYNQACQTEVVVHPGAAPHSDQMHVYSSQPMGRLKTVDFMRSPSVNITRIHGMGPTAGLSDAPSGFTNGCMAESTGYCRSGGMMPAPMPAPVAMPVQMPAPVIAQPTERIVAIGGGYDPSKFIPRTYGSNELVRGIAHIPTSIVDRSHANAQAVLNSGRTQPQPVVSGGIAPHPSMFSSHSSGFQSMGHMGHMQGNVIGMQSHTVTVPPQNPYMGSVGADGTYWEKVSGPTKLGGMQATQVICKRQAPVMNVQRPVVGVPTPVPTAVHMGCVDHQPVMAGGYSSNSRYGH